MTRNSRFVDNIGILYMSHYCTVDDSLNVHRVVLSRFIEHEVKHSKFISFPVWSILFSLLAI